ncbi:MAG: hypothetical protein JRL30_19260 [Deltaproteobacteria bacterium]|nr:hypothetical protein [Deltaproteobacteria bacterium]
MNLPNSKRQTGANGSYRTLPRIIYQALNLLRCKYEARKILRTIDLDQFELIQKRYWSASPDPGYSKYLNIRVWIEKCVDYYYRLELHRSGPVNILDIGTGCGYFPYVCDYYGHRTMAIDMDDVPMYTEITEFLRIDRRIWEVKAYEHLPDFGKKFNLITAFLVCFNNHDGPHVWGSNEWAFFMGDLARNQLTEKGKVFFLLNAERDGRYYSENLLAFFKRHGANVIRDRIYFETMASFHEHVFPEIRETDE